MSEASSQSRQLIERLVGGINNREWSTAASVFNPDSTWWLTIDPVRFPLGGERLALDYIKNMQGMVDSFEFVSLDVTSIIAEGHRAAFEVTAKGRGPGKAAYDNRYMFVIEVAEDGKKIRKVRQAMDPYAVEAFQASVAQ